jgi:hypothetical protein
MLPHKHTSSRQALKIGETEGISRPMRPNPDCQARRKAMLVQPQTSAEATFRPVMALSALKGLSGHLLWWQGELHLGMAPLPRRHCLGATSSLYRRSATTEVHPNQRPTSGGDQLPERGQDLHEDGHQRRTWVGQAGHDAVTTQRLKRWWPATPMRCSSSAAMRTWLMARANASLATVSAATVAQAGGTGRGSSAGWTV